MSQFQNLSKVSLKNYPHITGRIRRIDLDVLDVKRGIKTDVAEVWWEDGKVSRCPVDRLVLLAFQPMVKYPWEKSRKDDDKPTNPEIEAGKHDG